MDIEACSPRRHVLWWVYSPYPVLALLVGVYLMIRFGRLSAIGGVSAAMDVIGLCAFYGFLRFKTLLTQRFWIGFAMLYVIKLAVALALLAVLALEVRWDGSPASHALCMKGVGVVLGAPFLYAIVAYAFDARRVWKPQCGTAVGAE